MRRVLAVAVGLGLALAAACAEAPYTLETPFGLVGGEALSLKEGRLVFKNACFRGEKVRFTAPRIVFDKQRARLEAVAVAGEALGHAFRAKRLVAGPDLTRLFAVELRAGAVELTAEVAEVRGERITLQTLFAKTPRYRFKAHAGELYQDRFVAQGVWATPCREGQVLEVEGASAVFELKSGRLVFKDAAARYRGCTLARPQRLLLDTRRPPKLAFPLVLGYDRGWTLGLVDLPLPQPGEPFGLWSTHATLLAKGLGGPDPTFTVGVKNEEAAFSFSVKSGDAAISISAAPVFAERRFGGAAYVKLAPRFQAFGVSLTPFVAASRFVYGGLELRALAQRKLGPVKLSLAPWAKAVAYAAAPPYYAGGLHLRAHLGEAWLDYHGARELGQAALGFEATRPADHLRLGVAPWTLAYDHDLKGGWSRLGLDLGHQGWTAGLRYGPDDGHLELRLAYAAPRPFRGLALSPRLGFDPRQGLSRFGLKLAFGDGCLVYALDLGAVLTPWPDEAAGFSWRLGLDLL